MELVEPDRTARWIACLLVALVTSGCGDGSDLESPAEFANCGGTVRVSRPPERAVAMNQTAAEVLLALGLEESLVATGFEDNEPAPEFSSAYAAIPTHWQGYPTAEQFADVRPDFVYATLQSALDHDLARAREAWRPFEIEVYLSPWACAVDEAAGSPPSFELVARELREVSSIFGVEERGAALIASLRGRLEAVRESSLGRDGREPVVVWYDSGEQAPLLGAGAGVLQLATEAAGAGNPFDHEPGSYTRQSWAAFAATDPDWIGIVDHTRSPAARKRAFLAEHPETAGLPAVRGERYVVVPFSSTLSGVGVASVAERLAAAIAGD